MRSFVVACISLIFLGFCLADGSPVFPGGPTFVNDQPIYSPETGVAAYSSTPLPIAVSSVAPPSPSPDGSSVYHPDTYPENYGYPNYEPGYGSQSGYEGYLVPYNQYPSGPLEYIYSIMPYPATVLKVIGKIAIFAVAAVIVATLGVLIVLGICTFTPYCTLTFDGMDAHKLREEVRSLITPDRISAASRLVSEAIDKYQRMQRVDKIQ